MTLEPDVSLGSSRRRILQGAAAIALLPAGWRLWAAPAAAKNGRFLLIFLRGAYDSLSALVPYREPYYYECRPNIAIAPPGDARSDPCVALDDRWGLHPALAPSLLPLWQAGDLAFVPFSGTDFVVRSHFEAQDRVEQGQPTGARSADDSGFMNRLLRELGGAGQAVSFTAELPRVLQGSERVANVPLRGAVRPTDADFLQLAEAMYEGHTFEPLVHEGLALRRDVDQQRMQEVDAASRGAARAAQFTLEATRVARLLRDRSEYALGFIEVGGWDTHAGQGGASGALANQLRALSEGLAALARELGPEWNRTVVAVVSEFGRTFRENGNRGTDHGHGSTLWLLGGGLRGGRVLGEQASLGPGGLHQDRDVPVLNEYRAVLAAAVGPMYGLSDAALDRVFAGLDRRVVNRIDLL